MNMRLHTVLIIAALFATVETTPGQVRVNLVNANFGVIKAISENHLYHDKFPYLFYPELQIGGDFFIPAIRWGISWGYWQERDEIVVDIVDGYNYTFSGHIVGARFTTVLPELLPHWLIPVGVIIGISHHWIAADYLYGMDYFGGRGRDFAGHATTFDIGANVEVRVFGPVAIQGEVQHFVLLGSKEFYREQIDREAFKLGVSVRLD